MAEFSFGVKVGKKVRKDKIKEDKIFEIFKVYEESINLKKSSLVFIFIMEFICS